MFANAHTHIILALLINSTLFYTTPVFADNDGADVVEDQ